MGNKSQYLSVGTVLNSRYRIVRFIKSGGFGNTYEAEDLNFNGMRVAVKELFIGEWCSRGDDEMKVSVSVEQNRKPFARHLEKFKREAILLRGLNSTKIVRVSDVFEANGTAYYAMDYIDGGSLAMRLKSKGGKPMSESEVSGYLNQIMDALEYVHGKGQLHLDLKPDNIMTDANGNVVLIDFGTTKSIEDENGKSISLSSIMACTPGYAPPELVDGDKHKLGTHTDMYSLGATLHNLLTGKTPPKSSDIIDNGMPEIDGISEAMQRAIEGLMQPSINKRIKTVSELRKLLTGTENESKKPSGTGADFRTKDNQDVDIVSDGETVNRGKKEKNIRSENTDGRTIDRQKKCVSLWALLKKNYGAKIIITIIIILGIMSLAGIRQCNGLGGERSSENVGDIIIYDTCAVEEVLNKADERRETEEPAINAQQSEISTLREVDLGLSVNWAGWNVGATSPEEYGDYFAWGETSPNSEQSYTEFTYRYYDGSSYINIGSNISGTKYDVARSKWGGGWRMPTKEEMRELEDKCEWKWIKYKNETYGMIVTGPNGNSIFLPASGYCLDTLINSGFGYGYYLSATIGEDDDNMTAWYLHFGNNGSFVRNGDRYCGYTIRPVKARQL